MKSKKKIILIISLVTILILLILAGITIGTLTGENGLFTRAKQARKNTLEAQELENAIKSKVLERHLEIEIPDNIYDELRIIIEK